MQKGKEEGRVVDGNTVLLGLELGAKGRQVEP